MFPGFAMRDSGSPEGKGEGRTSGFGIWDSGTRGLKRSVLAFRIRDSGSPEGEGEGRDWGFGYKGPPGTRIPFRVLGFEIWVPGASRDPDSFLRESHAASSLQSADASYLHHLSTYSKLSGTQEGRYKATWKMKFTLTWREAGPPNHLDNKVDSDQ